MNLFKLIHECNPAHIVLLKGEVKRSLLKDHEGWKLNIIKWIPCHPPNVVASTSSDSKIHKTTNLLAAQTQNPVSKTDSQ